MTRHADLVMALLLAALSAAGVLARAATLHPVVYQSEAAGVDSVDVWFDADLQQYACVAGTRASDEHRGSVEHPLISTALYLPALLLGGTGAAPLHRLSAMYAGVWIALFLTLLRRLGVSRLDATLLSLIAWTSATGVIWMTVPESFLIGSITMLLPLIVMTGNGKNGAFAEAMASAASLSITVSNWMSGLLVSLARRPARQALQIAANAFVVITVLWWLQSRWFPANQYFLGLGHIKFFDMLEADQRPAPWPVLRAFFIHSMVLPAIGINDTDGPPRLSLQDAPIASAGWVGAVGTLSWLVLLALGALGVIRRHSADRFPAVMAALIACQLLLHLAVGRETFLYAMHYMPLLLLMAAHALRGKTPAYVRVVAITLLAALTANNLQQFRFATTFIQRIGDDATSRGAVIAPGEGCGERPAALTQ